MQLCVSIEQLAQARLIVVLSGSTSFPGETFSPKRDCEGRFVFFCGTRRLDEAFLFWANEGLAQASMSSLKREYVGCSGAGGLYRLGA